MLRLTSRIALFLLAFPSLVMAETTPLVKIQRYTTDGAKCPDSTAISNCKVRNAEILDTSTSWTMDVAGYSKLTLQIDHTFAAATAITVTCEGSINGGTTYGRLTSTSVSSGTGTVSAYTDSYATGSASSKIILEYGIAGYDHVRCDLGDTAATTDLDTIYANASVGG